MDELDKLLEDYWRDNATNTLRAAHAEEDLIPITGSFENDEFSASLKTSGFYFIILRAQNNQKGREERLGLLLMNNTTKMQLHYKKSREQG